MLISLEMVQIYERLSKSDLFLYANFWYTSMEVI